MEYNEGGSAFELSMLWKPPPTGLRALGCGTDKLRGLGVRVSHNGRKTYIVRYKWRGKSQTYTIGVHGSPWTPDLVRDRAADVLRRVECGEDPSREKRERRAALSVSELITLWLRDGPISRPTKRDR